MAWRTIDGVTLDPLGPFNELQTLVRGVLAPAFLLDSLRFFVLFEDDGGLVKKIAGYHQFHAVRAAIAQVVAASRPDGLPSVRGKGGVVWHTQGSGKSITMTDLWAVVRKDLGFDPSQVADDDLRTILTGLIQVVQGLGAFRTHASSAHGAGPKSYRLEPRHSRLAVHAAHTAALFVLESWDKKAQRSRV